MGMEFPIGLSMVSEIVPARRAGKYVAILEGFWPLGFIAAGIVAYFFLPLLGWRGIFIALSIPAIFVFVVRRYVPESPRWLEEAAAMKEADGVTTGFERAGAGGVEGHEPAAALDRRGRRCQADRRALFASSCGTAPTPSARSCCGRCGCSRCSATTGSPPGSERCCSRRATKSPSRLQYTVLISLAGIPGFIFSAWLLEAWGRKPTCVLMLVGSAAAAFVYGQTAAAHAPVAQLISAGSAMQFFMFGMWSVLYAYTPAVPDPRTRHRRLRLVVGRSARCSGPTRRRVAADHRPVGVFTLGAASFAMQRSSSSCSASRPRVSRWRRCP